MAKQYVVVLISNKCDPTAYGTFPSHKKAREFLNAIQRTWTEYDYSNYQDSQVLNLTSVDIGEVMYKLSPYSLGVIRKKVSVKVKDD